MKVEQSQPEFRPVVITLESEAEVAKLTALVGRIIDSEDNFFADLYSLLEDIVDWESNPYRASFTESGAIRISRR